MLVSWLLVKLVQERDDLVRYVEVVSRSEMNRSFSNSSFSNSSFSYRSFSDRSFSDGE